MQKAKHRAKPVLVPTHAQNGNGFHKSSEWISVYPPGTDQIASIAGSYKDDPFWDEFIQKMEDFRREELERDLKNLENEP